MRGLFTVFSLPLSLGCLIWNDAALSSLMPVLTDVVNYIHNSSFSSDVLQLQSPIDPAKVLNKRLMEAHAQATEQEVLQQEPKPFTGLRDLLAGPDVCTPRKVALWLGATIFFI